MKTIFKLNLNYLEQIKALTAAAAKCTEKMQKDRPWIQHSDTPHFCDKKGSAAGDLSGAATAGWIGHQSDISFIGSYYGGWEVIDLDCKTCIATVSWRMDNSMGRRSGSYDLIPNAGRPGVMTTIYQDWLWSDEVDFSSSTPKWSVVNE